MANDIIKSMIISIASGRKEDADREFRSLMASSAVAAIDIKRVQTAKKIFEKGESPQ
jgi:hypothetical protein